MARLRNAKTQVVVNVDDDTAERLTAEGWVSADAPNRGQGDEPGGVPSGSVAELTEWVGEDRGRAARALEAEQDKGDKARVSLVGYLTKLIETLDAEQQ